MAVDLTLTTELKAVNYMLSVLGEQPVTSLPSEFYLATLAQAKLAEVSKAVQTGRLHCNSETDVTLSPGVGGKIAVPTNALMVDATVQSLDVTVRGGYLYDLTNHTDVFTQDVHVDITYLLDFEDLPDVLRQYITIKAGRELQRKWLGADSLDQFSQEEELRAWTAVLRHEMRNADKTIVWSTPVSKILQRRV